jgi:tetratricopeptide (TPR) repeat protein
VREELPAYLQRVAEALQARPMALSEAAVQEWCQRLDDLRAERRFAEVTHLHAALLRVFSPPDVKTAVPLDVRLHRRLGDMYLAARDGARAAEQFELGLTLVPNDMYLKHRLALAQAEAGNAGRAREILEEMERVDPALTAWNPEVAGLKGRLFRDEWKRTGSTEALRAARDAYWVVMDKQPDSYYMADNVGQLSLALGDMDRAKEAFTRAIDAVNRLKERSVWSLATLATSWLALGDTEKGTAYLCAVAELSPTPRDLESIEGGLRRLREGLKAEETTLEGWLRALKGV